jgi:hypothetical protein
MDICLIFIENYFFEIFFEIYELIIEYAKNLKNMNILIFFLNKLIEFSMITIIEKNHCKYVYYISF